MAAKINLTGQRFGKLVALHPVEPNKFGARRWLLQCDCGGQTVAMTGELRAGKRKACRCGLSKPQHGMHKSRLHTIWGAMKARCNNPKRLAYKDYGGRGITVCESWQRFIPFMEWALANGYRDDLEIDRIDNDDQYAPGNCRWVTRAVNAKNKRPAKPIGLRYTSSEIEAACLAAGVDFSAVAAQLPKRRVYR
jgi:hypothetical protein